MPGPYARLDDRPSVFRRDALRTKTDRQAPGGVWLDGVRHLRGRRARRHHEARRRLRPRGGVAALVAVLGPGHLPGRSADDPAGITTSSILGADHGYRLLSVLAASTGALIVFHELGARLGVVTERGLCALVRERREGWRSSPPTRPTSPYP